jgi:hypothetical protein
MVLHVGIPHRPGRVDQGGVARRDSTRPSAAERRPGQQRDGLYVACTESLSATLLTLDGRLARSAPVPVELP